MSTENTPAKRQMSFHILENGDIRADFADDSVPEQVLVLGDVPESVKTVAITEGLISRARGYTSRLSAEDRTPQKLAEAIATAFENLKNGVWKLERASGGGAEFSIEIEAAFLFRKMKAESKGEDFTDTLETVAELWGSLTDDQKKQVKDLPRYKAAYAEVKAKRQAEKAAKLMAKADAEEEDSPM